MSQSIELQLRDIIAGNVTGNRATNVLCEAIPLAASLEDHAQSLRSLIKSAEDFLVYGQIGRPSNETYR